MTEAAVGQGQHVASDVMRNSTVLYAIRKVRMAFGALLRLKTGQDLELENPASQVPISQD